MGDYNNGNSSQVHTRRLVYGNEFLLNGSDEDDDTEIYHGHPHSSSETHKLIPLSSTTVGQMKYHDGIGRTPTKRYTSWAIIICTILFMLLMVYIPILQNVQSPRIVPIPGWDKNTTRDTVNYVFPNINTTLIDPVHVCSMASTKNKIFLLIIVCSSSVNFEIRQSIRDSWANVTEFNYPLFSKINKKFKGNYLNINYKDWRNYTINTDHATTTTTTTKNITTTSDTLHPAADAFNELSPQQSTFNVKVLFLIGQTMDNDTQAHITNESDEYGDIIQESFLDSYNNLTVKTIMMLKWFNINCLDKVKYLMKCDDDTFVNVPNLLHILLGGTIPVYNATVQEYDQLTIKVTSPINRLAQHYKNLLLGSRFCNSKPIANVSSKWYTPMYMYDGNIYPNYLSGTGYVMSSDVAVKLYNVSLTTPLFHLEDVYLTGICAKLANIKPRNHHLFSYTSYKKPCELKGLITKHQLTASDMRRAYEFVTNTTIICPKPDKYFRVRKVKTRERYCN